MLKFLRNENQTRKENSMRDTTRDKKMGERKMRKGAYH
jgi:hypothetical protein